MTDRSGPSGDCPHAHDDAAYVLGALAPDERAAFERHLATCPTCSRAVADLAGMPGLLARVPTAMVDPTHPDTASVAPPVPDTLLPRLVREVRRTRRSRAWLTAAMVGTAAAVAAIAVGFAAVHDRPDDATTASTSIAPAVPMRSVGDDPVAASISLTSVGWGTRLELTCDERGEGPPSGPVAPAWSSYAMYVHTRDGRVEKVASWQALPGKVIHVSGATATDRGDIVDVDVRNAAGVKVLNLSG